MDPGQCTDTEFWLMLHPVVPVWEQMIRFLYEKKTYVLHCKDVNDINGNNPKGMLKNVKCLEDIIIIQWFPLCLFLKFALKTPQRFIRRLSSASKIVLSNIDFFAI